jgi:hypothetical protein
MFQAEELAADQIPEQGYPLVITKSKNISQIRYASHKCLARFLHGFAGMASTAKSA